MPNLLSSDHRTQVNLPKETFWLPGFYCAQFPKLNPDLSCSRRKKNQNNFCMWRRSFFFYKKVFENLQKLFSFLLVTFLVCFSERKSHIKPKSWLPMNMHSISTAISRNVFLLNSKKQYSHFGQLVFDLGHRFLGQSFHQRSNTQDSWKDSSESAFWIFSKTNKIWTFFENWDGNIVWVAILFTPMFSRELKPKKPFLEDKVLTDQ